MGKILHSLMMLVLPVLITFLIGLVVSYNSDKAQDQCYDILKRMLDLELELRMKALNEDHCNIIICVITFIKQFRNKLFFFKYCVLISNI